VVNQKPLSQVAAIRALFGLCHEKEEPEPRRGRQRLAPLARHLERLRQSNCAETPRCASRRRTTWWSRVLGNGMPPRHCDRTSPLPGCSRSCRARGARRRVIRCLLPVDLTRNSFRQLTRNKDLRIMTRECPLLMPTLPSGCTLPFTLHGAGRKKKVTCFTIPSCLSARRIEKALLRFLLVFWSHSRCTCK
jgi:hypothetical protein